MLGAVPENRRSVTQFRPTAGSSWTIGGGQSFGSLSTESDVMSSTALEGTHLSRAHYGF